MKRAMIYLSMRFKMAVLLCAMTAAPAWSDVPDAKDLVTIAISEMAYGRQTLLIDKHAGLFEIIDIYDGETGTWTSDTELYCGAGIDEYVAQCDHHEGCFRDKLRDVFDNDKSPPFKCRIRGGHVICTGSYHGYDDGTSRGLLTLRFAIRNHLVVLETVIAADDAFRRYTGKYKQAGKRRERVQGNFIAKQLKRRGKLRCPGANKTKAR